MKNSKILLLLIVLALAISMLIACDKPCESHVDNDGDEKCDNCGADVPEHVIPEPDDGEGDDGNEEIPACETHVDAALDGTCDVCARTYETVTVAQALELCGEAGNITTTRYYLRAKVSTLKNAEYGEMYVADDSGEIYVYGTYSHNGELTFPNIAKTPVRGDEVVLHCILQNYNGTKEVKNARLVGFTHTEADLSDYTAMSVADARNADDGALITAEGVVARITYANGHVPCGFILVDATSSIYVYGSDAAGAVAIGNKVKVAGVKDYWILGTETNNAEKFGYLGCNQLSDAMVIENDNKTDNAYDKSWITETTVKELMDTPVTEDITTQIYKVNALVKKVPGTGFVNYYIDDLDGVTGSYVYTQCNGSDFGWLDQFDGKICTVYLTVLNAKSTTSGCNWRLLPVEVVYENYTFDLNDTAEFAVKYHALGQFLASYTGDPATVLNTTVSSELLGFEGATLAYASSDEDVVYFTTEDGNTVFHCGKAGTATVTVTGSYNGTTYTATVDVTVAVNESVEYIGVKDAIDAQNNTTVTVKGIVGPSLVNQVGFYLIDENGSIPVRVSADVMATLAIGYEVIVEGTRTITKDGGGQICIDSATVVSNNYGSHDYSTDSFITGKTISELNQLTDTPEATTAVYVVTAKIYVNATNFSVTIQLQDPENNEVYVLLYSGGKDQYKWLQAYEGQTITLELAICDWNAKGLKGCVLAVVNDDGTKVYNTLNFTIK